MGIFLKIKHLTLYDKWDLAEVKTSFLQKNLFLNLNYRTKILNSAIRANYKGNKDLIDT